MYTTFRNDKIMKIEKEIIVLTNFKNNKSMFLYNEFNKINIYKV